jgi:hypothetical protein
LTIGSCAISYTAIIPVDAANAANAAACAAPGEPCLDAVGERVRAATAAALTVHPAALVPEAPEMSGTPEVPEASVRDAGIPPATLSLYKTITCVPGATLTDQIWYLAFASAAATTGGAFFAANVATTSVMAYSFE